MEDVKNSRITAAAGSTRRGRSASAGSNTSLTIGESTACGKEKGTQTVFSESRRVLPETEVAVNRICTD